MPSMTAIRGTLRADSLRLRRDGFLIGITVYIFVISVLMRWLIPLLTEGVASQWDFDLTPFHPLLVSHFVVQLAPLVPGIIGAFLLLESREDGTVKALLVAPIPLLSYVSLVCGVMCVTAATLTVVLALIIGIALPSFPAIIAAGLAAAPGAPIVALLVAAIANNKVQAFAYLKLFGLGPMIASGAYFVPEPLQWLAAIYPPYCASKAYWVAEADGTVWPIWILAGLVGSAIWVMVLQRQFLRAARR